MFGGIDNPVTQATISSVPSPFPASFALPSNAVQSIAGALAQQTAVELPQAQTLGAVIKDNDISVGMYGMNPRQLETAGILKPGSSRLIRSLAASGKNVNQVMPPSMFTGMPGAENLPTLKVNLQAQTDALSENLTQAQSQLQIAGVMTGQEVAGQVGGAILSTATNGLDSTLGAIDAASKGPLSNLGSAKDQIQGKADKVLKDIGSGNFAGKVAEAGAGALSGLQSSVEAIAASPSLDQVIGQAKGIAASAFESIKASMPTLQAGVPQNLTAIAKSAAGGTAAASAASVGNDLKQQLKSSATNLVNSAAGAPAGALGTSSAGLAEMATGALQGAVSGAITSKVGSTVSNLLGKAGVTGGVAENLVAMTTGAVTDKLGISAAATAGQNAIASFQSAASLSGITSKAGDLSTVAQNVTGGIASAAAGLASGITNLPGGQSAAGSIQNLAKATQNLPGTADLTGAIQGAATNAINGITGQLTGKANDLLNKANGLLGQADSAANQLKSLASAGLPAGAAAQLQSAMGSIASAGSGIKMPSIGINTTDRGELTAAITSVLEDPQIPAPDLLGEVSEAAKSKIEEVKAKAESFKEENKNLQSKYTDLREQSATEFGNYLMLRDTLPQGDPMVEEARQKAIALTKQADDVRKEMETLYKSNPDLAVANNYVATTYESSTTTSTVTENGQTTTTTTTTSSSTVTTGG